MQAYVELTTRFFGHIILIAAGMIRPGEEGEIWDEEDGFFYDVLRLPDGRSERLKVRSRAGLLPFCAVIVFALKLVKQYPEVVQRKAGEETGEISSRRQLRSH